MDCKPISFDNLVVRAHHLWSKQWVLLTSGDFAAGHYNMMTVAWGSLGTMWGKPFAQVVVRPSRYTFDFMEQYSTFTLTAFPDAYHKALQVLGTKSGRESDKVTAAGLTPVAASVVAAPAFAEASLTIECRKIYVADFDPRNFLDAALEKHYPQQDYHRIYYGEIVAIAGTDDFAAR